MRRTVIIGLGGTGCRVIKGFARLLRDRRQERLVDVPLVGVLGVDVDAHSPDASHWYDPADPVDAANFLHIGLTQEEIAALLDGAMGAPPPWVPPDFVRLLMGGDLVHGARRCRMLGRLAFMFARHQAQFHDMVVNRVGGVLAAPAPAAAGAALAGGCSVYVIGNLVSGTGSGACVDAGYAVRGAIAGMAAAVDCQVIGVFTLWHRGEPDRIGPTNCFHALRELNHYMAGDAVYGTGARLAPGMPPVNMVGTPFDLAYLVSEDVGNTGRVLEDCGAMEAAVAEWLYVKAFLWAEGGAVPGPDMEPLPHSAEALAAPCWVQSLGVSVAEYPAGQVARRCANRFVTEAVEWCVGGAGDARGSHHRGPDPRACEALLDRIGLVPDPQPSIHEPRLGLLQASGGGEQLIDLARRWRDEAARATRQYEHKRHPGLPERMVELPERPFEATEPLQSPMEEVPPGAFVHAVDHATHQLTGSFPMSIDALIADILFDATGGPVAGIGAAQQTLDCACDRLARVADEPAPPDTVALGDRLRQLTDRLRWIESSHLLVSPLGLLRRYLRRRALAEYGRAAVELFQRKSAWLLLRGQAQAAPAMISHVRAAQQQLSRLESALLERTEQLRGRWAREAEGATGRALILLHDSVEEEVSRIYRSAVSVADGEGLIREFVRSLRPEGPGLGSAWDTVPPRLEERHTDVIRMFAEHTGDRNAIEIAERCFGDELPAVVQDLDRAAQPLLRLSAREVQAPPVGAVRVSERHFYPGGDALPRELPVTGPGLAPEVRFAIALREAGCNWQLSRNSVHPGLIAFVREARPRAVRDLAILDHLRHAAEQAADCQQLPFASRTDVQFRPI